MTRRRILGPYWLGPAEAGMCARDAARLFGRPEQHAHYAARRLGIRFADGRHNPARLPPMTAEQGRTYQKLRRNGIDRAGALTAIGVAE